MPDPVFANIGKLLLATQIYDMHRIAHEVSGGLIVTLPGPDEDHNPATAATLADVLRANPAVPYDKRIEVARLIEDLTASYQGGWYSLISLHGGGSPAAMKQEIWRNYPVGDKVALVERLLDRGVLAQPGRAITANRQPGKCCDTGCTPPSPTTMVRAAAQRGGKAGRDEGGIAGVRGVPAPLARRPRRRSGASRRSSSTGQSPFDAGLRRQPAAVRALVRRRQDQPVPQRRRPPPRRARPSSRADLRLDRDRTRASVYTLRRAARARCSAWRRCCVGLGVGRGDRVLIYMPMIPEAVFAMLACARIGAIHSVVFGGFASGQPRHRIDDAEPTVIVSADAGVARGKVVAVQAAARRGDPPGAASSRRRCCMVDRGLAPMDARRRPRRRLRRLARART